MNTTDRDEINFYKFLKSVRQYQKASLVKTTFGVCSKSGMSKVENGERLPEKLVRDRITARLGISGEEYEEYLVAKEYKQWQERMEIIRCINKKDADAAEEKINAYAKRYCRNNVQKQFVATMRYLLFELKGYSCKERLKQITIAMTYTVPDIEKAFAGCQLLADQELNLIMEYVSMCDKETIGEKLPEWQLEHYKAIDNYVQNSYMDKIAQTKVYTKLSCHVCELVFVYFIDEEGLGYALDLCNRAIELSRDTVRLYYFVELIEFRIRLMKTLNIENLEENEEYQDSVALAEVFHELYEENELPPYMANFTYLYTETECNDVAEAVRIRRQMMGMSQTSLGDKTSSQKTVYRIEHHEANPHIETLREVLAGVGLCGEFKRARVVTTNAEAMRLSEVLYAQMNSGEYEKALETYEILYNQLDLNIMFNYQEMQRAKALILRGLKKIEAKEHCRLLENIISCTVDIEKMKNGVEIYLSKAETYCMENLVVATKETDEKTYKNYIEMICENLVRKEELESSRFSTYEVIMYTCANYAGGRGEYEKSVATSRKLLKESLRNRRALFLANCEYNELWIKEKLMEKKGMSIDFGFKYKSLKRSLLLSILTKKENWKTFIQQKLELITK